MGRVSCVSAAFIQRADMRMDCSTKVADSFLLFTHPEFTIIPALELGSQDEPSSSVVWICISTNFLTSRHLGHHERTSAAHHAAGMDVVYNAEHHL